MAFSFKRLFSGKYPFYEHLKDGSHVYTFNGSASWDDLSDKLKYGYTNPILLPILQLLSHYVTKVQFKIENVNTKELITEHSLISLLNQPNIYQSKQDFLAQFIWFKYCLGYNYILPLSAVGFYRPEDTTIYNLNASLVEFPEGFKTKMIFKRNDKKDFENTSFLYDKTNQNLIVSIKDIIPFYDLPNGIKDNNLLTSPSRLDALEKPLTNISKAFEAKNIVLGSNGKELYTNKTSGNMQAMPLTNEEKNEIETRLSQNFGLGLNKKRSVVTNSDISWQSLHINLADLGLDESVIKDAQAIVNAFNIPRELISYDGKGAKYENQLQATIGFIQGVIQDNIDDICNSLTNHFNLKDSNQKLIGSFDHLPIMQEVENKKADSVKKKAEALKLLLDAGIDSAYALTILGMSEAELNTSNNEQKRQQE
ncbi:Phage portal family protein [Tenacibaculum maritimum]|uniref:phage portal protein n=2 Tax=Tenacibaculum maritimum TaxID=107401 RepID=UPI0012E5DCC8|nr:phage portal protein [Tenacibaculum maritimum]CAA0197220.1 Phage portal family protein [Tenacibaculum maritimum]